MTTTFGIIVGSLRQGSYNHLVADTFQTLIPAQYATTKLEIDQLPYYNPDLETDDPPVAWTAFRAELDQVDGVLFFSPEYNRDTPAVLKNALDVASRPRGQNLWAGKPALVVTTSPGSLGGYAANHSLRAALTELDMPTLQQPEAYIGNVLTHLKGGEPYTPDSFEAGTKQFFGVIVDAYIRFFEQLNK